MGFFDSLVSKVASAVNNMHSLENTARIAPNQVGVYIARMNGRVMYVGRAIECRPGQATSGLRKRLQEHWRGAPNCNREIHANRDKITITMQRCETVEDAKRLEGELIRKHDTVNSGWNKRHEL